MALLLMQHGVLSSSSSSARLLLARVGHSRAARCIAAASAAPTMAGMTRKLRVAHIMLPLDKAPMLDDLESQLQAGQDFAALAKQHSICPSARRGGELGWLSRGSYLPAFEDAAFSAKAGTAAVRATTERGHHLIKVLQEKQEAEVQHMSVQELAELLANPVLAEELQLVDVREQFEYDSARLPGFRLLPMSQANEWAPNIGDRLQQDKETVVLCHHGVRSMQAAAFLVSKGFTNVKNVTGGIDAYSQIDRSVPFY